MEIIIITGEDEIKLEAEASVIKTQFPEHVVAMTVLPQKTWGIMDLNVHNEPFARDVLGHEEKEIREIFDNI